MNYEEFNKGCFEEAKRLYKTANADQRYVLECLFPELAESEDERVRKGILEHIQLCTESIPDRDKYIAWLEKQKQGEKKPIIKMKSPEESLGISSKEYNEIVNDCLYGKSSPTDIVEPKFKESEDERIRKKLIFDFQVLGKTEWGDLKVKDILAWLEKQGESYTKRDVDDAYVEGMAFAKNELEKQGKKKSPDEVLKIRQELYQSGYNDGYKHGCEDTKKQGEQKLANSAKTCKKSQRMVSAEAKEALYDKPATIDIDKMVDDYANNEEFGKPLNSMIRAYRQGLKDAIGKVVSESAWSEEDDVRLQACLDTLQAKSLMGVVDTNMTKWLKSLKQRIGG